MKSVTYVATTNEINIEEYVDLSPRNWIPKGQRKPLVASENSKKLIYHHNSNQENGKWCENTNEKRKPLIVGENSKKSIHRHNPSQEGGNLCVNIGDKCEKLLNQVDGDEYSRSECIQDDKKNNRWKEENTSSTQSDREWSEINEVIKSDFLISPGDIYPNRKVELQDAPVTEETRKRFEDICDKHQEAFSKNNKDIGRTQLIQMEIDTGNSVLLAQSPYTLPLKHYDWVRNEIETLEKAGVIREKSVTVGLPSHSGSQEISTGQTSM